MVVYCIVNLDEIVKIPAVYLHYKKYLGEKYHKGGRLREKNPVLTFWKNAI